MARLFMFAFILAALLASTIAVSTPKKETPVVDASKVTLEGKVRAFCPMIYIPCHSGEDCSMMGPGCDCCRHDSCVPCF
ncbi:unnamed protein product [Chondrus crispus]|uniref:Uncharacterized protein n=1 Tax=Chondrus crispus TaxID=2769 RepID=R7QNP8_CHOCR|nr:unnamed protein product [Chondrus crispus]CDF39408.1 unnamed protein product [Chondrus crispus]|eukprot:XP_005719319.1 unnamed protein product [Chondrus crispus]